VEFHFLPPLLLFNPDKVLYHFNLAPGGTVVLKDNTVADFAKPERLGRGGLGGFAANQTSYKRNFYHFAASF